jgi:feruloyl-CoA synthase
LIENMRNLQPFNDAAALAPPEVVREDRGDGTFILRHPRALQPYARCIGDWLDHWARTTPDAHFLCEKDKAGTWLKLTYRQVRERVGRLSQGLLDAGLPEGRPVVILSDNSIDAALLGLAAMHVGRPMCTVSSAYSRLAKEYSKVGGILSLLKPAVVYGGDAKVYGPAIRAWGGEALVVFSDNAETFTGAKTLEALGVLSESPEVVRAAAAIRPDDHAKYLLTSGSTGQPKVVINTHRMLCANQQQIAQAWPFLTRHKLTLLDWLPWSHTFGANHNFNMVLSHGGTLYIDEGRPAPGLIEKTLANLRDVKPNFYFSVPRGFDMLLPHVEQDDDIARHVFENMEGIFYSGAALPQSVWCRLEEVVARVRDRPLWFTSAWGATETAPAITTVHWGIREAGCLGLPLPGVELKFIPNGGKLELRARGPNVFPGYLAHPGQTEQAFDEEGFYRIGDAGRLVEPGDPSQGVAFDGRVAEDFKLTSGTWVSVGTLRPKLVTAMAPYVADVVVTGHDRAEIGLLVFPAPQAKALSAGELEAAIVEGMRRLRGEGGGSSQVPTRALVQAEPTDVEAGEITDKGYINQRAVIARRTAEIAALYEDGNPRVLRA